MFIGALLDLGVNGQQLEQELEKLSLPGYHLHITRGQKASISGVKFDVHVTDEEHHDQSHSHAYGHHHHSHEPRSEHEHEHDEYSHAHEHHHHDESKHEDAHHHGRNYSEIKQLITASGLSDWVKEK